jgi:ABC-2 type transport system permease protein
MNVFRALLLVTFASFKNRIIVRIKRLRNPRYLLSAIAGLAYFWFMVFRRSHIPLAKMAAAGGFHVGELGRDVASLAIFVVLLLTWALPQQSGGLELSEAEIGFLFPAPLSRGQLLLYKLFRSIPPLLFTVFFMTLFGFRQAKAIGLLTGFAVMTVYMMMVGQARARLKLARIGFLLRSVVVLAIAFGVGWLFIHELGGPVHLQPAFSALKNGNAQAAIDAAEVPFRNPVLSTVLFIPRLFATALFPATAMQLFISMLALLVFGYVSFLIAARVSVSFEEASIAVSEKRMARQLRMQGRRSGRSPFIIRRLPPPFRLSPTGSPEVAIIWKNVTAAIRTSSLALVVVAIIFSVNMFQGLWTQDSSLQSLFTLLGLLYCAIFPFLGTAIFTQDLRLDMRRIELLKGYPISGERLVAAEIAAPLAIVSVIELTLLCGAAILAARMKHPGALALAADPKSIILALLFTIPLIGAQLVIRNAAPILIPAWALRSKEDPRGFVMTGQRILMLAGNLLVLSIVLVPAFLLFFPALLLAGHYFAGNPVALALAAVPSVAVLSAEVYFGVKALGAQFEQIDVTNDLDPVSA